MQTQVLEDNRKTAKLRAEFKKKSQYLKEFCIKNNGKCDIAPLDYYCDYYSNDEEFMSGKKEKIPFVYKVESGLKKAPNGLEDVLEMSIFRDDIAVFPASFFGWPKQKNLCDFYAIVIDIDGISAADLYILLKVQIKQLLPTYLVNSGHGVHLVYLFDKPIAAYSYRHKAIKLMIEKVSDFFNKSGFSYKIDPASKSLVHPYRVVGSKTKLGQQCVVFRIGKRWSIDKMLKKLGIETNVFKERKKITEKSKTKKKTTTDNKVYLPNGKKQFYEFVLREITDIVEEGHRYMSLFALAVVGYKCRVPRDEVEDMIEAFVDMFNQRECQQRVKSFEVAKAMKGYSHDYLMVTSRQLENWMGIEFPRKTKRNGRKQAEHLEIARAARNKKSEVDRKSMMKRCLEANPQATLNELVEELGWGKATVSKYRKMVRES